MATTAEPVVEAWSDEDLMRRIQGDDVLAFEMLYDRYSARAFGLIRMMSLDSHRAEEALQEGFIAVWRSRGTFDCARGSARAWLFTVIRNRGLDVMRRTGRDISRCGSGDVLAALSALDSVERDAEQHDEADRVRRSLLQLPGAQREVVVLAYFGGLTHTEIAARLRLPLGTVKGRARLGLQKLRADFSLPAH